MLLTIPKDMFDNYKPPQIILCNTDKEAIGEIPAYDVSLDAKWNTYSELSFSMDRNYVDVLTGETKEHPLFEKIEGLRKIYLHNMGYFVIQDPDTTLSDNDTKVVNCFSSEYETGQKYLENFFINTGEDTSVEVTYYASQFGEDYYNQDNLYKKNVGAAFDPYEKYFVRQYESNGESYNYEQVSIADESEYQIYDGFTNETTLYVKTYPNVRFYWPTKPELSLLHLIFKKIPEWDIGEVDRNLWHLERKFEEERISVYDFLMNTMCDTFKCVIEWDTIKNKVNFYEEAEDGVTDNNEVQTRFDTDIYISKENLANEIQIQYSTDDIKTKLKVSGRDGLDIREINLGQNYILNLDYYNTEDWFGPDLYEAWQKYKALLEYCTPIYSEEIKKWTAAYNAYNEIVNAIPVEGNVLLIGDVFEKLYCTYSPIISDSHTGEAISELITNAVDTLTKWLKNYSVNEDINGTKKDNVLLTLKQVNGENRATIRVYYDKGNDLFKVRVTVTDSTGSVKNTEYSIDSWVRTSISQEYLDKLPSGISKQQLTSKTLFGSDIQYKIASIGTLGAYLCLTKDETIEANIEDYGINLLKEKKDTYTTIFLAQIENNMANEGSKCDSGTTFPSNSNDGTMFFNTETMTLYKYNKSTNQWEEVDTSSVHLSELDYLRYIENYNKLKTVQRVLDKKQKKAMFWLNGYAMDRVIKDIDSMTEKVAIDLFKKLAVEGIEELYDCTALKQGDTYELKSNFNKDGGMIWFGKYDSENHILSFYISGSTVDPVSATFNLIIYLDNYKPIISFADSQGFCMLNMNKIKDITNMENNFTEGQWKRLSSFIREDEYSDDNFALTGYESETERLDICQELLSYAQKNLKKICQPSLEFSANMANILAIPEFKPLLWQFKLGNFIRVGIRPNYIKRARLLEVHLYFDDLSDFSCNFGNLITTKSEIDKHAELLQQAVNAGKTVASSASNWQKGADKATALDKAISEGLRDAALEIGATSGQDIKWDETGIWGRKLIDGTTDQYDDEQFRMSNNKLVFTNNNWETTKSVFGKFTIKNANGETEEHWGVLSDAVVSGYIKGSIIEGGSLEIGGNGGKFIVNEDGSVQILAPDNTEKYATTNALEVMSESLQYRIELSYSGSTVFASSDESTTITAHVYKGEDDITDRILGDSATTFSWFRSSANDDSSWNSAHANSAINTVTITNDDVTDNALFSCKVQFDETKLQ